MIDAHVRTVAVITEGHIQIQVVDEARSVRLAKILHQFAADAVEATYRDLIVLKRLTSRAVPIARGRIEDRQTGHSAEIAAQPGVHRERGDGRGRLSQI